MSAPYDPQGPGQGSHGPGGHVPGPGSLLDGRYRLDAVIARGGMSTVHLATDERLDRHVAVKLLDPALATDRAFVDRFTLEARSVARLSDPGIVQVFDQGVEDGCAFLVMELVTGGTLRELLDERGPMPPYAAAAVLRPLLGALREAHAAGLVHRDIKPENVLISTNGVVKLADFGLVRAVAESRATSRSVVMGTAAYLSPEQISGTDTDCRSDLYSLGVLAFEMLTGRTPFDGDSSVAVAYRRLQDDVPAPSADAGTGSDALDDLVLRATERDVSDRYTDADAMLDALTDAAREHDFPAYLVPAPRQSAWSRARKEASAHTAPGHESEFDAAVRESGEAVGRPAGPVSTRVRTRAVPVAPGAHAPPYGDGFGYADQAPPPDRRPPGGDLATVTDRAPAVRPRRRLGCLWLVVVVAMAAALAVAGWWLGSGRFADVPSVRGMSVAEATHALESAGLSASTRTAYSDDVPAAAATDTDPTAGARVPRGDAVAILVSAGRPVVPDVGGDRTVDTVTAHLRERTLEAVRGPSTHSDSVPAGTVIRLAPTPGTTVAVGTRVTMTLSSGPAPVTVPRVEGLDADRARGALTAAGFVVGVTEPVFDPAVPGGTAVASIPASGEEAAKGSSIVLRVSNALTVPDLRGKNTDEAMAALRSVGLSPVSAPAVTDSRITEGHVVRTDPGGGARVDPASPVVRVVPSDSVPVPMVLGRSVSEARRSLEAAGFTVSVNAGRSGLVYGQTPLPGRMAARGGVVEISALG